MWRMGTSNDSLDLCQFLRQTNENINLCFLRVRRVKEWTLSALRAMPWEPTKLFTGQSGHRRKFILHMRQNEKCISIKAIENGCAVYDYCEVWAKTQPCVIWYVSFAYFLITTGWASCFSQIHRTHQQRLVYFNYECDQAPLWIPLLSYMSANHKKTLSAKLGSEFYSCT